MVRLKCTCGAKTRVVTTIKPRWFYRALRKMGTFGTVAYPNRMDHISWKDPKKPCICNGTVTVEEVEG